MPKYTVAEITDSFGSHVVLSVRPDEAKFAGAAGLELTYEVLGSFETWQEAWECFQVETRRRGH